MKRVKAKKKHICAIFLQVATLQKNKLKQNIKLLVHAGANVR